jgi:segregation and condensation protein B
MDDPVAEGFAEDAAPEELVAELSEDEEEGEGISVFAYTRAPARSAEDEEEFDRDDIKAAVMRLRKEERTPDQPMSEWGDDE